MLICVAQVLHRYAPVWGCDAASFLKLRPCFLGGVMGATGNKPPIAVAPKGVYTYKDFFRNAKHFDIPMAMPPKFPANTIQGVCSLSNVCCTTPGQPPSTHDRLPCECKSSNACLDSAFHSSAQDASHLRCARGLQTPRRPADRAQGSHSAPLTTWSYSSRLGPGGRANGTGEAA